jgi:hypothetical protein
MWKASNDPQYPIKMKTRERQENAIETRSVTQGELKEVGRSTRAKKVLFVMLPKCGTKHLRK